MAATSKMFLPTRTVTQETLSCILF